MRWRSMFDRTAVADASQPAADPLRKADLLASLLLTMVLCEAAALVLALAGSWALLGAAANGSTHARLYAAVHAALDFRSATRLPRLLAEGAAFPFVTASVARRPSALRAPFMKERVQQAIAAAVAALLTIRMANVYLVGGRSEPAAVVVAAKLGSALSPLLSQPVLAPLTSAAGTLGGLLWAWAQSGWQVACAIDSAAHVHPVLRLLYPVADFERVLEAPVRFLSTAMAAFFAEVVMPLLRTLGFVTMQTLG